MNLSILDKLCKLYNQDIRLLEKEIANEEMEFFLETLYKKKLIGVTKKGFLKKLRKEKIYAGKLDKKANFGFLIIKDLPDMYVSGVDEYYDKDLVIAIESSNKGKSDAVRILRLIDRPNAYLVVKKTKEGKIEPFESEEEKRIVLKGIDNEQIKPGTIFSVLIKEIKPTKLIVVLHNIISDENDPDYEMKVILDKYNIQVEFDDKVIEELQSIEEEITKEEIKGRIDLRQQMFFTIDGDDSKDLDDAISLIKESEGYRLFVSIADVSHYLTEGSHLDKEAQDRATSVYFIDRVVPMIPKKISNGICSLHAGVDRLTMTCEMFLDNKGRVKETKIYNSIINSKHRLTYSDMNAILMNNDKELIQKYNDIYAILKEMNKLSKILNNIRIQRGSFNLEDTEAKFKLDKEQNIVDIYPINRQDSEKLIEEFMIIANESVTKYVINKKEPFIYRVHGTPNTNKLANLRNLLYHLEIDIDVNFEELQPEDFKDILDSVEDPVFKRILSKLIVRSMQKAVYSEENIGHFGLASKNYTHFTSPIRRYPDLLVHRLLKTYIQEDSLTDYQRENIKLIAEHSSEKEIQAIRAEQEIEDKKKAQYMKKFMGQTFKGTVSGIEDYGVFVELENTIRGLIRFSDLKTFKSHNIYKAEFLDETQNIMFGQELDVTVSGIDLIRGLVDFLPVGYELLTEEEKEKIKQDKRKKNQKKRNNRQAANKEKNSKNQNYPSKNSKKKNNRYKDNGNFKSDKKRKKNQKKRGKKR